MKLLHIASFKGNIGDIINHEGFYSLIKRDNKEIDQLEIRRFYNNSGELKFDLNMLNYINSYDGLILGGRGFFDIYWDCSETGTTLNMDEFFLNNIQVPVIVNAMGVHIDYKAIRAIDKFRRFFKRISMDKRWLVTLRNDGSMIRLSSIVQDISENVIIVPDNGFAYTKIHYNAKAENIVGLSITNDLFSENFNGVIDTEKFNADIAEVCRHLLEGGKELLFFLHAPQDLSVLHSLFLRIGSSAFRSKIKIAPYDVYTLDNARVINQFYARCRFVIAMRFHGNVIAIKNQVPVVGLAGHEQISGLYEEVGLSDQCIVVKDGFKSKLLSLIQTMENDPTWFSQREKEIMKDINSKTMQYGSMVNDFLDKWQ